MLEKKNCIYDIYKWMGMVGKYTGCFPLPGEYEKKEWSRWTKRFINYVIPALNFGTYLFYFLVPELYSIYYKNLIKPTDLTGWLLHFVDAIHSVHFSMCIVFNHFYSRRELVTYLKMYSNVEELLKPKKRHLKRFVCVSVVLVVVCYTFQETLSFLVEDGLEEYFDYCYENPSEILTDIAGAFLFSIGVRTHPYLMYFIFQRVLFSAFDQLYEKIKKKQNENLSGDMRVMKMKKYARLYGDLCELSTRLDYILSPLMFLIFIKYYLSVVCSFAFILSNKVEVSVFTVVEIVSGFFVLFLVSNFAYHTKNSREKIFPAIYSTFNSDEKTVKTLQNFSLQSMYCNKPFSASGFFKLDRELIITMCHSVISQIVVFYKMLKDNKGQTEDSDNEPDDYYK